MSHVSNNNKETYDVPMPFRLPDADAGARAPMPLPFTRAELREMVMELMG